MRSRQDQWLTCVGVPYKVMHIPQFSVRARKLFPMWFILVTSNVYWLWETLHRRTWLQGKLWNGPTWKGLSIEWTAICLEIRTLEPAWCNGWIRWLAKFQPTYRLYPLSHAYAIHTCSSRVSQGHTISLFHRLCGPFGPLDQPMTHWCFVNDMHVLVPPVSLGQSLRPPPSSHCLCRLNLSSSSTSVEGTQPWSKGL